jgi:hypothetical protein
MADSMEARHVNDSTQLAKADATIARQVLWLAQDSSRIDRLTRDLRDLREATARKGELWVLGVHLPDWADDAAEVAAALAFEQVVRH